jgi:hypothetical protein
MAEHKPPSEDEPEELFGPEMAGGEQPASRGFVADAVRKAVLAGAGALFLTEEGARRLAREWKLPKEIVGYVSSQATGAKDEILRVVTQELRQFFESEALRREFVRALTSMSIEVRAEIRLKPAGEGKVKPTVRASVKPKVRKDEE